MKQFIMFVVVAATMWLSPAFAENAKITNIQNLIDQVKADKNLLIAHKMDLTDQESMGIGRSTRIIIGICSR